MNKPLLRRPRLRRDSPRVWSIKTITVVAIFVVLLTAVSVFTLGKRSLFHETELTLAIIAAGLFVFLAVGLYRGVRVRRGDLPGTDVKDTRVGEIIDGIDPVSGGFDVAGAADDPLSAVVAFVLGVVALLLLALLLWLLLSFGVVLWVFTLAALAWVFYRALR